MRSAASYCNQFFASASDGLVANFQRGQNEPIAGLISCFVNLLKSEEARKQIVLDVDGPATGKAKALSQPQHRLEARDGSPRRVEGLETSDFMHVLFHPKMVTLDALLEMLCDIMHGIWLPRR